MIEPRDASLLFTFRGLGMFMPSKYLQKLLQRQRQRQQQRQQQQLPATIAVAVAVAIAFAIEPSMPELPIVTSGQITASAKQCQLREIADQERSSTGSSTLNWSTNWSSAQSSVLSQSLAACSALFFGSLQRRTLIFIDSSQRFINDRAGCARSLQIEKSRGRERIERGSRGAGSSGRLSARDDAATHQSEQASMLSRDHSAVPHETRREETRQQEDRHANSFSSFAKIETESEREAGGRR